MKKENTKTNNSVKVQQNKPTSKTDDKTLHEQRVSEILGY